MITVNGVGTAVFIAGDGQARLIGGHIDHVHQLAVLYHTDGRFGLIRSCGDVRLRVVCRQVNLERVAHRESKGQPRGDSFLGTEISACTRAGWGQESRLRIAVFNIRILIVTAQCKAPSDPITEGTADCGLGHMAIAVDGAVKFAGSHVDIAGYAVEIRFVGNVVHQSSGGVAPEQGALRALEDLYPIDVEQCKGLGLGDGDVALIQIDSIRRLDNVVEIVLGHPANRELGILSRQVAADVHAGAESGNVVTLLYAERGHLLARERGHCDRHVLQVLLSLLGGDDDLFQRALRRDLLCERHGDCHHQRFFNVPQTSECFHERTPSDHAVVVLNGCRSPLRSSRGNTSSRK